MNEMKHHALMGGALVALLLLAGCQKSGMTGRAIRFSAESRPEGRTRAAYSGELVNGLERIDWSADDHLYIYSPEAEVPETDPVRHYATYVVNDGEISINTANPARSQAAVSVTSGFGLYWTDASSYSFYGVFPSDKAEMTIGTTQDDPALTFAGTIPAEQDGGAAVTKDIYGVSGKKIVYSDAPMYMAAYADNVQETENGVSLLFEPAFSAFHINAGIDNSVTAMTIKRVTLESATDAVAGDFTGAFNGTGWVYTPAASGTSRSVSLLLGTDENADDVPDGIEIQANGSLDMVLLALPAALTDLTLRFVVEIDGVEVARNLKLAYAADDPNHPDEPITFTACHQAYLSGLLIPGSVWEADGSEVLLVEASVEDWNYDESDFRYGESPVINASKLESGSTDVYSFSVFAPLSSASQTYNWKITVLGSDKETVVTSGVTLTQLDAGGFDTANVSVNGVLSAAQPTESPAPIRFRVDHQGVTGTYYLSFSLQLGGDGPEFSINSEVVRNEDGLEIVFE